MVRRYAKAQVALQHAQREFEDLNSTVDPTLLTDWSRQEEKARMSRALDVGVMDIYDVQQDTGIFFPCLQVIWLSLIRPEFGSTWAGHDPARSH